MTSLLCDCVALIDSWTLTTVHDFDSFFEAESSDLRSIRADEGARECTRTFEIRLVPAAAGRDIPIKRADRHAIIYYVMHQQAPWDNADSVSFLSSLVKQN